MKIDWDEVDLASSSDAKIAETLGVSRQAVHAQRMKRGITKDKKAGALRAKMRKEAHGIVSRSIDAYLVADGRLTEDRPEEEANMIESELEKMSQSHYEKSK